MVSDTEPRRSQTFHVVNLGCKVNRVESDDFTAALLARGGEAVNEKSADLVIVNTCTVTGEAEKKTRKAVRGALRANDRARVIVTGCAPPPSRPRCSRRWTPASRWCRKAP